MKWIEVIKLRSSTIDTMPPTSNLLVGDRPEGLLRITMYRHATVETDVILYLAWESETAQTEGSALALQLIYALKPFGLVNHSVWIEDGGTGP